MITGLHHIVLFCTDTERSRKWYERVGFAYKRGYDGMHWFALGDGEIMLHPSSATPDDSTEGNRPTIHVAVTGLDEVLEKVQQAGLNPVDHQQPGVLLDIPVARPWGDREFELQDPDGQWWAFTEKASGSSEAGAAGQRLS